MFGDTDGKSLQVPLADAFEGLLGSGGIFHTSGTVDLLGQSLYLGGDAVLELVRILDLLRRALGNLLDADAGQLLATLSAADEALVGRIAHLHLGTTVGDDLQFLVRIGSIAVERQTTV